MCDGKTRKMMWNSNKFESVNKRKTKKKKNTTFFILVWEMGIRVRNFREQTN